MTEPTVPVTPDLGEQAIHRIETAVPETWRVMPIGGVAVAPLVKDPGAATKDLDLVLVLLDGAEARIPTVEQIVDALGPTLSDLAPRKDETSVAGRLGLEKGTIQVEIIRGRRPAKGGYFVPRTALLAAAKVATTEGKVLRLPGEALAFLKAWAAVDQDKLIRNEKDGRGFHAARAGAFRRDVRRLLDATLDHEHREPDGRILAELLNVTGGDRRRAVETVLRENGWSVALQGARPREG